ncbi:hypothetical protein OR573_14975 [Halomonas sp. CH40]
MLLDEGAIVDAPGWSDEMRNIVAAVFRIEKHRDEKDVSDAMGHLAEWLSGSEQSSLRRAIIIWFYRVLLPNRAPGLEFPEVNDFTNLHEVHDMLAERIKKWPEQWEARGEARGEAKLLKLQITSKYGECPDWAHNKLNAANAEQLEAWGKRIFRAETLEELLSC